MSDKTGIEWSDATWNPLTGCSKVSPGCANCYAETLTARYAGSGKGWPEEHRPWTPENAEFNVRFHPERLDQPLRWTRPRRVFVNSMSDLFHELVSEVFIRTCFSIMASASQHQFQVLTKRPERMRDIVRDMQWIGGMVFVPAERWGTKSPSLLTATAWPGDATEDDRKIERADGSKIGGGYPVAEWKNPWPGLVPPNIWLGTSIENNRWVSRAGALREAPAAVRFLSCEPLLGPLSELDLTGIDWVIVGGESAGPPERMLVEKGPATTRLYPDGKFHTGPTWTPKPEPLEWVRDLRDRCNAAGVAFLFKQWGGPTPKSGGRELDGRTWDEYPVALPAHISS